MRRFCLGDIHGEYEYLKEVLEKSGFNYEKDLLIQIGDLVDRGPEPFKCMDELLMIENLILIKGNHDANFIEYMNNNIDFLGSYPQNGTHTTVAKWKELSQSLKNHYKVAVFDKMVPYHLTSDNIIFTHGGFPRYDKLDDIHDSVFAWDRELVQEAMNCKEGEKLPTLYNFKDVFIGHTPTLYFGEVKPIYKGGVWNVDTGSGKGGPLTIMDIDTKEYWQSDYPQETKELFYEIENKRKETNSSKEETESDKDNKETTSREGKN